MNWRREPWLASRMLTMVSKLKPKSTPVMFAVPLVTVVMDCAVVVAVVSEARVAGGVVRSVHQSRRFAAHMIGNVDSRTAGGIGAIGLHRHAGRAGCAAGAGGANSGCAVAGDAHCISAAGLGKL